LLELDRGNDRDARLDDVGRVEPAAETDLDGADVDCGLAEDRQREGGRHVEEARAQIGVLAQALDLGPHFAQRSDQLVLGDGRPVDAEALAPAREVRDV
jgi:hypothetical protein